ncbi:hypothetical protein U27_00183 [Candidatus Vecturithrix granuli]|uniref:Uncharacterized protein n=1 Tax=Vecturithrix granuli TaxID=1499967 RepID=A0A081C6T7_VECG1|nr:hypothetical protein U27_00183 [Candidatus Vecturithrix granuli]
MGQKFVILRRFLVEVLLADRSDMFDNIRQPLQQQQAKKHSIMELEGLGTEIWPGIDVQEYVRQERASWDSLKCWLWMILSFPEIAIQATGVLGNGCYDLFSGQIFQFGDGVNRCDNIGRLIACFSISP